MFENLFHGKVIKSIEEHTDTNTDTNDEMKIHFTDGSRMVVTAYGQAYCTASLGYEYEDGKND